jgi:hypothetical protein
MTRNQSIIAQARALGVVGRHAGSKPISRLLQGINQVNRANAMAARAAAKRAKNAPAAPASLSKVNTADTIKAAVDAEPAQIIDETPAETAAQ